MVGEVGGGRGWGGGGGGWGGGGGEGCWGGGAVLVVVLLALSYYLYSTGFLDALLERI